MKRSILPLYFYLLSSVLFAFSAEIISENEHIVFVVYLVFIVVPFGLLLDSHRKGPVVLEQPDE
jgi:hypothetical protein